MDSGNIPFRIKAILGKGELPEEAFQELRVGDVIVLEQESATPLSLEIEGEKVFEGFPSTRGTRKAIELKG